MGAVVAANAQTVAQPPSDTPQATAADVLRNATGAAAGDDATATPSSSDAATSAPSEPQTNSSVPAPAIEAAPEPADAAENIPRPIVPADGGRADAADNARDGAAAEPAAVAPVPADAAEPKAPVVVPARLVVRSWAGAYGAAQEQAVIEPLSRDLGFAIERQTYGNPEHGSADEPSGGADALELDQQALLAACKAGSVIKIRKSLFLAEQTVTAADGGAADADFIGTGVSDCGVPTFAWSSMLIVNGEAMAKLTRRYRQPSRLEDLLDVKTYPGKRALIREPQRLLEMMLMARGVARADVYRQLATRGGQDAAFETLDKLSASVLWVDGPREALVALDQNTVTIAMTFSGRAFRRLIAGRLEPIWDGHIIDFASWAVPVSSRNQNKAERFIRAATMPETLAAQARLWPYGPMRRSAVLLAERHHLLDTELATFMPTSDLRFAQGLVFDAAFWATYGDALEDRFAAWLSGVPLGIRVPPPTQAPPPPLPPLPRPSAG